MTFGPDAPHQRQVVSLLAEAASLLRASRPADAIAPLTAASLLQPRNAVIQHDLGLASLEAGRLPEAVAALKSAVSCDPHYADAYLRLGIALEDMGDHGAAIAAYDRATTHSPSLTEAWFRAGALVHSMGHAQEAIGCFRRAASSGPKTAFGRLGGARALLAEDRVAEAERQLRAMLSADPGNAVAHDLLGNLLAEAGQFEEARRCFLKAVETPRMAGSYYDLVRCRPFTAAENELVSRMQGALSVPGLDTESRLRVHLALGKAADDLGEYQLAMQNFDTADALRPKSVAFDPDEFDAGINHLIERTSPAIFERAAPYGSRDQTPILIVGMPRSGTTLVEQIVSSHPGTHGAGELNFWNARGAAWLQSETDAASQAKFHRDAAAEYLRLLRSVGRKSLRVTDKMPFNFLWAGLIHLSFPQAVFIHCRRAAIDAALSIHQTLFHSSLAFPTGGSKLVRYFRSYEKIVRHWRQVLPANRFIEVDYETLTQNPAPEIRRLIASCGLPWDEACLHPENNSRPVKTPSKWQTRQPINRNSVERWRRYEAWLGPLRELLPPDAADNQR